MSQSRFNTANIMTLAALNVVANPGLVGDQLRKAEEQRKADEALIQEQNKRALLKALQAAPKQYARSDTKQQNQQIHQPRSYRR